LDEDAYEAQENLTDDIENLQLLDRVRYLDIKLLKTFNIGSIVDLMLEKKKVKFLVNVTSSEKVDKEKRYQDFKIISLPYPGCEFFKEFRDNNYSGEGLVFDWSQKSVDAAIGVPLDNVSSQLNINFDKYKDWDLIQITQNYMRLLLKYIQESSSGLLIHCISGWDRTPAFCSLLRLSLWADGLIHQSLSAIQILYFTIGESINFHSKIISRMTKFIYFSLRLVPVWSQSSGSAAKRRRHFLLLLLRSQVLDG
jgi:myotubularin-related protein 14